MPETENSCRNKQTTPRLNQIVSMPNPNSSFYVLNKTPVHVTKTTKVK